MEIKKLRDLTMVHISDDQELVIACDSCGAIGNKEMDIVKTTPEIVGYFTCRVPLAEVIAIGAEPITVINTLSVEMNDTGKGIIQGIKRAISPLGLPEDIIVTGSTEENFPVCQTGIGVTIIGIINKDKWQKPITRSGYLAVVAGLPKVGQEVLDDEERTIISPRVIKELRKIEDVGEIVPVGSKGVIHEIKEIAKTNYISYKLNDKLLVDINKSAGPATCAVITIDRTKLEDLKANCPVPVNVVGEFS